MFLNQEDTYNVFCYTVRVNSHTRIRLGSYDHDTGYKDIHGGALHEWRYRIMTPEQQATLLVSLGALAAAIGFFVRQWAITRAYVGQKKADGDLATQTAEAGLLSDISNIAKGSAQTTQAVIDVVRENTKAATENAAQMQGMVIMFKEYKQILHDATIGVDEMSSRLPAIETGITAIQTAQTELGGSLNDQFGPVVDALKGIGGQLTVLVTEIQNSDTHTNTRLTELISAFQEAEKRLLQTLEPIVIRHMADTQIVLNGKEKDHS